MRDTDFRGRSIKYGQWVYGALFMDKKNGVYVIAENFKVMKNVMEFTGYLYDVDSETIGQFTGRRDVFDINIYEGDFCYFDLRSSEGEIEEKNMSGVVKFNNGSFTIGGYYIVFASNIRIKGREQKDTIKQK